MVYPKSLSFLLSLSSRWSFSHRFFFFFHPNHLSLPLPLSRSLSHSTTTTVHHQPLFVLPLSPPLTTAESLSPSYFPSLPANLSLSLRSLAPLFFLFCTSTSQALPNPASHYKATPDHRSSHRLRSALCVYVRKWQWIRRKPHVHLFTWVH